VVFSAFVTALTPPSFSPLPFPSVFFFLAFAYGSFFLREGPVFPRLAFVPSEPVHAFLEDFLSPSPLYRKFLCSNGDLSFPSAPRFRRYAPLFPFLALPI